MHHGSVHGVKGAVDDSSQSPEHKGSWTGRRTQMSMQRGDKSHLKKEKKKPKKDIKQRRKEKREKKAAKSTLM